MPQSSGSHGRQFDGAVQRVIVDDILRAALPLLLVLSVAGLVFGVLAWAENPYRVVAGVLATGFGALAWWAFRSGKTERAIGFLVAALVSVPLFAMFFNGGLRAPAAAMLLVLVAMVGWFYGRRAATVSAALATALAFVVAALTTADLLRAPPAPPPLIHAAFFALYVWLIWIATAFPHARLRATLAEQTAHEEALRQSELALKAVFDRTAHLMMLVGPDGRLVSVNRAAGAIAGLSASTGVGRHYTDAVGWPPQLRDQVARALGAPAPPGSPPERFELETANPARRFEFTLTRFFDDQSVLRYLIVEGRDVTLLLADQERRSRARRLELVGQLAGGVAHDFNNALAAVVGSAEVLRAELGAAGTLPPAVAENIETIVSVGMRASDLTRKLLTFGRRAPLARQTQSLHALLTSTLRLLTRTLPSAIHVRSALEAPCDQVEVDSAALESIVLNLAINARDAMPHGGTLTLCTREGPPGHVRVEVRDTGIGIAPELLDRVFEPYFTTKADGQGSGIGLASVFGAMSDHGGTVSVESQVGQGTAFFLDFPLVEPLTRGTGTTAD